MALTKITSDVIASGAVESTHIASGAISSSHLTGITTDNVSEGSTNTYFTNARARGSVSVTGGGLSYDSGTGVIQIGSIPNASLTNSSLTVNSNSVSLGGSVTLDTDDIGEGSTNLYFTNARAQGAISGGTGVTVSSGEISIGQDVATSSTPTFGNITTTGYIAGPATFTIDPAGVGNNTGTVVIAGNLQVDGTTTTINSTTLEVDDLNITLASGAANAAAANGAGITVDGASATILYQSSGDEFRFNKPLYVLSAYKTGTGATFVGQLTNSGGKLRLQSDANRDIQIGDTNNADIIHVDTSEQNVGIGTSSPNSLADLHVADTSDARIWLDATSGNTLELYAGLGVGLFNRSNNFLNFGTDNVERMRLNASGKLGIATTSSLSGSDYGMLTIKKTGSNIFGDSAITINSADTNQSTLALGLTGSIAYIDSTESGTGTVLPLAFATGSTEKMRIDSSGNVGIGTIHADSRLDVTGGDITVNTTGTGFMNFKYSNSSKGTIGTDGIDLKITAAADLQLLPTGNVGIGTSSPSTKLEVVGGSIQLTNGTSGTYIKAVQTTNSSNAGFYMASGSSNWYTLVDTSGKYQIYDGDAAAIRVIVDGTGSVGIGTNNPQETLHLFNSAQTWNQYSNIRMSTESDSYAAEIGFHRGTSDDTDRGLFLSGDGTNKHVRVLHGGNVGIGTTSPSSALEVNNASAGATVATFEGTYSASGDVKLASFERSGGAVAAAIEYNDDTTDMEFGTTTSHNFSLKTADTRRLTIASGGNVGIGTSGPASSYGFSRTLEIQGAANAEVNISQINNGKDWSLGITQGTNYQQTSSGQAYVWESGGGQVLRITSDGNVGIGNVTAPTGLEVYSKVAKFWHGNTNYYTMFEDQNEINTYTSAGANSTMYLQHSGGDLEVSAGILFVDRSASSVGIGTTAVTSPGLWYDGANDYLAISHWASPPTPAAMLHLSDNSNDLNVPQIRIEGRDNPGDTRLDISVKDAAIRFNLVEGASDASNGYGQMIFKTNAAANTGAVNRGGFKFDTGASSNSLVITNTAGIGFGTDNPFSYGGADFEFKDTSSAQTGVRITSSASSLEIGTDTSGGYIQAITPGDGIRFYSANSSAADTTAMTINSVGIATTPQNPAFRVYTSTEQTSNGVVTTGFTDNDTTASRAYDRGGHFNTSNGRFTAPVDGVYVFSVMWDSLNSHAGFNFLVNGTANVMWEPTGFNNAAWESKYYGTHLKLSTNDYVQLQIVHANGTNPVHQGSGVWGHWAGALIG